MKNIIIGIIIILLCCGCSCGNKVIFDTTYKFDKAVCNIAGEYKEIEIEKWTDYDGEQIQLWDKRGNYYLVSSYNCILIKGDNEWKKIQ